MIIIFTLSISTNIFHTYELPPDLHKIRHTCLQKPHLLSRKSTLYFNKETHTRIYH